MASKWQIEIQLRTGRLLCTESKYKAVPRKCCENRKNAEKKEINIYSRNFCGKLAFVWLWLPFSQWRDKKLYDGFCENMRRIQSSWVDRNELIKCKTYYAGHEIAQVASSLPCFRVKISLETFIETENSCGTPQFSLIADCYKISYFQLRPIIIGKTLSFREQFALLCVYTISRNCNRFTRHCSIDIAQMVLWVIAGNHEKSMHLAYPSEHPSRSCIRLFMCYCKPPSVFPGSWTYRNGCDTNFSCGCFKSVMFGRSRPIYG